MIHIVVIVVVAIMVQIHVVVDIYMMDGHQGARQELMLLVAMDVHLVELVDTMHIMLEHVLKDLVVALVASALQLSVDAQDTGIIVQQGQIHAAMDAIHVIIHVDIVVVDVNTIIEI